MNAETNSKSRLKRLSALGAPLCAGCGGDIGKPHPSPVSEPNRLIAYSAAQKLRDLGYKWDEAAEDWVKK